MYCGITFHLVQFFQVDLCIQLFLDCMQPFGHILVHLDAPLGLRFQLQADT